MGLDIIDWIFQALGRGVCWLMNKTLDRPLELSDSACEVVGLITALILIFFLIMTAGATIA
ncbi:hypothetical protein [Hydrogenophaga sp.]|uniref:hypothetical protein n=1 Tax=Hydrogenophaga sp. TaxID=1904254 RepID=UPI00271F780B|nr:hypothetical protein [Hydrogenophaga sp.]MDO9438625.1 hypothetical protein [Hydrogenophaga sp.]